MEGQVQYVLLTASAGASLELPVLLGFSFQARIRDTPEEACRAAFVDWGTGLDPGDKLWLVLEGKLAWQVEIPEEVLANGQKG